MEAMGSKTAGKQLARRADVPTVPGIDNPIESLEDAQFLARDGLSCFVEGGGWRGGKGMRVVANDEAFSAAARCCFGGFDALR